MKIGVIGGRGHFGSKVVEALEADGTVEVVVASRSSTELPLDLSKPETFPALRTMGIIINCADSVGAPTDALMRFCLQEGLTLLDIGADDVHAARQAELTLANASGHVVLGAGLFPGLSTSMCWHIARGEPIERLDLGIRLSPLSGAGDANVDVMTAVLSRRQPGGFRSLPFAGAGVCSSVGLTLPDAPLLTRATGSENIHTWMAFKPGFLRFNFAFLSWLVPRLGPVKGLALWCLRWQLWLVRAVLFKNRKSAIELTASLNGGQRVQTVAVQDGRIGVGLATAAMALLWKRMETSPKPGLHIAGTLFDPEAVLEEMQRLGNVGDVTWE